MNVKPSDVVLLTFPGVHKTKVRPAVVISSDLYHNYRPDLIVGLCTSQVSAALGPTDYVLVDWVLSGLTKPTAFRSFLLTTPVFEIIRIVGKLSDRDWKEIQKRLLIAIELT